MSDDRLLTAAHHIMNTLVAGLTAAGIDVPDRRYIHVGQIAHDYAGQRCADAFVVAFDAAFQGNLGGGGGAGGGVQTIRCAMPLSAQFTIALLRCVPMPKSNGDPPSAAELQTSAEELMKDAWTLNAVIVDEATSGTLIDDTQHVTEVSIGGSLTQGPDGGVGGIATQLFVGIL